MRTRSRTSGLISGLDSGLEMLTDEPLGSHQVSLAERSRAGLGVWKCGVTREGIEGRKDGCAGGLRHGFRARGGRGREHKRGREVRWWWARSARISRSRRANRVRFRARIGPSSECRIAKSRAMNLDREEGDWGLRQDYEERDGEASMSREQGLRRAGRRAGFGCGRECGMVGRSA